MAAEVLPSALEFTPKDVEYRPLDSVPNPKATEVPPLEILFSPNANE